MERGDVDAAFEGAPHVFSGELDLAGQEHFYLETHASLAQVDEAGQVFVQCSTQHPTETQDIVAHVLGIPSHAVTVQCLRMGGGFGGKEMQPHGFAAIAALGARLTGRPVRLRLTRSQDMTMTGKRHGFHAQWRVAFEDDGRLRALDATLTSDGGWSLDLSEPVLARALCHVDNAYWIPHVRVHGRIARTHKTSQTAFRGFGGPQGMLVVEDALGRCAPLLGIDPVDLRRRNFYTEGQTTPYGQLVRHPERMETCWDQVVATADVVARRAAIAAWNARHEHTKRALAVTPVKFGISFNFTAFNQAGALVHVYKDGSVLVTHGGTEMGQGLHTKMLQVAATALGVPLSTVRLAPTRTDKVPNTSATAASSGADLNGAAVKDACEQVLGRLREVAGTRLGVDPAAVRFADGRVTAVGTRRVGAVGRPRQPGLLPARAALGGGFLPHRGPALGQHLDARLPVQVLLLRRRGDRGRGRRLHRRVPHAPGRHRPRRRRQPLPARRPRPGGGRVRAGRRLADAGGPALGRGRRADAGSAGDPGREHLQAAVLLRDARGVPRGPARAGPRGRGRLRLQGRRRAPTHAGVLRARGPARGGGGVRPTGRVCRPRLAGHAGGGVVGPRRGAPEPGAGHVSEGAPGVVPAQPDAGAPPLRPHSERAAQPTRAGG